MYALPLAREGYSVHLIDPVPLHVSEAREASALQRDAPLASAEVGDARWLMCDDEKVEAVLLLGPLYHLTSRDDRLQALREAYRVVRPGRRMGLERGDGPGGDASWKTQGSKRSSSAMSAKGSIATRLEDSSGSRPRTSTSPKSCATK